MASLHRDLSQYSEAESFYDVVSQSPHSAISTKMIAAKEAYAAAVSSGSQPDRSFQYIERLEELVGEAKTQTAHPLLQNTIKAMDDLLFRSDQLKAAAYANYGKFQSRTLKDSDNAEEAHKVLSESLIKSAAYYETYLEKLKGLSKEEDAYVKRLEFMNLDRSASLHQTGTLYSQIAHIASQQSRNKLSLKMHQKAVDTLNIFF